MSGHVVSTVRFGASFAACHRDARFSGRTGQVRWEVKVYKLVPEGLSIWLVNH